VAYGGYFTVGPTAVGKSSIAHNLALRLGYEVLSADSMLIYKGMDIGTAKPSVHERDEVVYHGVDLTTPDREFSVWDYRQAALSAVAQAARRGNDVIVAGGTGLYIKALTQGLDPLPSSDRVLRAELEDLYAREGLQALQSRLKIESPRLYETLPSTDNPRRVIRALEWAAAGIREYPGGWGSQAGGVVVGLTVERSLLHKRIYERVEMMYGNGLIEEGERLLSSYPVMSSTAGQAIGYAEVFDYIRGHCSQSEAMERTAVRTRRLAKRQMTWFRHQCRVSWVEIDNMSCEAAADRVLSEWEKHGATEIIQTRQ
jgi:tRNA dimethylallyltransferase